MYRAILCVMTIVIVGWVSDANAGGRRAKAGPGACDCAGGVCNAQAEKKVWPFTPPKPPVVTMPETVVPSDACTPVKVDACAPVNTPSCCSAAGVEVHEKADRPRLGVRVLKATKAVAKVVIGHDRRAARRASRCGGE